MGLENMIRVIPHRIDDAAMGLSIDRALFNMMNESIQNKEKVNPIIRTYQFSKPTVIFGNQQMVEGRCDSSVMKEIDIVKRDTGGGHMYFNPEDIHFSVIAPFDFYKTNDLILQYQKANSYVVEALRKCGYNASHGRTSIKINDKILVGAARKHEKQVALHQGSILYTKYDQNIFRLLMARNDEIERWEKLVTSLQDYGNNNLSMIPKAIISSIGSYYKKSLTEIEIKKSEEFYKTKYTNPDFIKGGTKDEDICLIALEWTKDDDKK